MRKYYAIVISILLLVITNNAIAQPGWTIYDETNSILSLGPYAAISIDQQGNIWVGGDYTGLFKFNGIVWTKYSTLNTNILHDNIKDILIDNSNKVWVANYKGVSVFNGTTFTNYDTLNAAFKGLTVYALGKDKNGKIWLSSKNSSFYYKGITTYDGSTWTNLTGYPSQIVGNEFLDFAFTSSNVAWIASESGITKYSGAFSFYPKITTGLWSSSSVAIDASSNIWAGGYDGLLKYDGSTWSFLDNVTQLGLKSNTQYYDIYPDGNILWIATSSGLLKFDRNSGTILANYKSTNSPLEDNGVMRIAKDANGYLWLATTIGIVKMNPSQVGIEEQYNNKQFSIYPNPSEGIFNFSYEGKGIVKYKIYSINGTLINDGEATSNTFKINLVDAPKGIYLTHIITENSKKEVIKLIKY